MYWFISIKLMWVGFFLLVSLGQFFIQEEEGWIYFFKIQKNHSHIQETTFPH